MEGEVVLELVEDEFELAIEHTDLELLVDEGVIEFIAEIAQGPAVASGGGIAAASGVVAVASMTWGMPHNLGIPEELFNPSTWWFEDENGVPMEPVEIVWTNANFAVAQWDTPVRGGWVVN